ncbi:MAG: hypothetical protein FWG89_05075 [Treponema sp.]|nr:hypothetical protein [Treponema sp.]
MAFDKKSSMYSNSGKTGSPEDLDAYGVWVKSEPQDISANFAEAMGFGGGAVPFEANIDFNKFETGFDTGFGTMDAEFDVAGFDIGFDEFGVSGFPGEIPGMEMEGFTVTAFDDQTSEDVQDALDEKSSKLLLKITEELSSIRTELSTLKQEFSEKRTENVSGGKTETGKGSGFFTEEDDEKITLTGDEMDNFFSTAGLPGGEVLEFDSLREEDRAALKRLSEENEAAMISESAENDLQDQDDEIIIDFDNLGIDFSDDLTLTQAPEKASGGDPLDNLDELQDFRLEGVDPVSPAPDDISYLEDEPFLFSESPIDYDDISFDDSSSSDPDNPLEINLDDFSSLSSLELDDSFGGDNYFAPIDLTGAIDKSQPLADSPEDLGFLMDIPAGIDDLTQEYPVIDDISLDLNAFETGTDPEISDNGLAEVIPEGFEISAEEESNPFDDDLDAFAEEDISLPDDKIDVSGQPETAAAKSGENPAGGEQISSGMKNELKDVLSYMDHLLEFLPDDKIKEFARSEHFETYRKLFKELGLV